MNYSTIKKVVAYSMVSVLAVSASAQTATTPAKTFGGTDQYRTWSVGISGGIMTPVIALGGTTDFNKWKIRPGVNLNVRKQFTHTVGAEAGILAGSIKGLNENSAGQKYFKKGQLPFEYHSFDTRMMATSLMAVFNVATIDFMNRENSVNFFVKGGIGINWFFYDDIVQFPRDPAGTRTDRGQVGLEQLYPSGAPGVPNAIFPYNDHVIEQFFPLGWGAKFKLNDKVNFDLGYNMYFLDGDNLDGNFENATTKDKWSYGYVGVEFSLGDASKPDLTWANPVAAMYDELKDPTLRQELEALKGRVSTLENTVSQLSADTDGDGVSNKFDKCAGTPAGTQVDGSGCPIKFPAATVVDPNAGMNFNAARFAPIQFEFDSSVLKTSSYAILDQLSSTLKSTGATVTLTGYASAEGTDEYNTKLSADRANSVKTYLVNSGVDASKVTTVGAGEANPIASNSTEEGRIQNRRVEIK